MNDDEMSYNWLRGDGNMTDFFTFDLDLNELLTMRRRQVNEYKEHFCIIDKTPFKGPRLQRSSIRLARDVCAFVPIY